MILIKKIGVDCKYLRISSLLLLLFGVSFGISGKKLLIAGDIAEREFVDRRDIDTVVIAEGCGVREIPDYAFLGCDGLKKVILPEGVVKIGFQAFSECRKLESIDFPSTLEDIGSNSFAYCENLSDVVFPGSLKHIGHNAFSFCGALESVDLPDSVGEIESYAFSDCGNIRKVKLPGNDRLLGELIFNCCDRLEEIIQPSEKVPPFDCGSYIFDPDDREAYRRCVLVVPEGKAEEYGKSDSWGKFADIKECQDSRSASFCDR